MYQESVNSNVRSLVRTLINRDKTLAKMKDGLGFVSKLGSVPAILAPMATGSAVVADEQRLHSINDQHRKLAAIDMEMYGVYRAASASRINPLVFGAKVVVDTADSDKGDHFHEYGCALSARFCVQAITDLIEENRIRTI